MPAFSFCLLHRQYLRAVFSNQNGVFNVGGQFKFTEKDAIKAQYSDYDGNASMIAVGIDHDLSKQMQVYVAYALVNNDGSTNLRADNYGHGATTAGPALGEDPSVVSVGLTYNF